jgi:diaminopimelate decarboxylase
MAHVQTLIGEYFEGSENDLQVGGLAIADIVAAYGTPLYIYDAQIMAKKWAILRSTLPPEFSIYYSVKANPNLTVLRFFLALGCGLEVASIGEFQRALQAGCSPQNILFAGPGKTEAELEQVLKHGIGEIHIESFLELERVSNISRNLGQPARVAVRVNPTEEAQGGAMQMGGKPLPFGIDEECLDELLDQLLPDPFLEFQGIHLFVGTQILDHEVLVAQYRKGLAIARQVAKRQQQPLKTIDLGGGLGIPYFTNEQKLDMVLLKQDLEQLMIEIKLDPLLAGTQFMVEPGRFLVAEAGIYVVQIQDIKVSRGKTFLVTDGGLHQHLTASGNLGQVIRRNFPVALLNQLNVPPAETVDVVGPLCTPLDVLARSMPLPKANIGDLIGVFQSGAYARSASPLGFLSHPAPPEIWVENGQTSVICPRGAYDDRLDKSNQVEYA